MTELLTRTTSARAGASDDRDSSALLSSVWLRGALAALWAVCVGLAGLVALVLVAWAADSRSGAVAGAAIRTSLQLWLAAHRVPLHVPGGSFGIAPLGLTLLLAFVVARAAAVLARSREIDTPAGVGLVSVAVGLPYAVLTTFVAAAATTSSVRPSPVIALVSGAVLGGSAAAWGAARGTGQLRGCWSLLPAEVRAVAAAGGAALGVLLGGATALLAAAVAAHAATAGHLVTALGGGSVAAAGVIALDVALVPNAVICVLGYASGPGFALGAGTSVSLGGVNVGALPALPLLAAVPHGPAGAAVEGAAMAVLVAAGVLAAWMVARLDAPLTRSVLLAAAAGPVAGVIAAVLAVLAGGPAGPGRMTAVGPSPWQLGLAVAGEVGVVAFGAAGALTWRRGR
jgi:hypothetical protein